MLTDRRRRSLATRVTLIATTATAVVMGLLLAGLFVAVTEQLETATVSGLQARSRDLQAALEHFLTAYRNEPKRIFCTYTAMMALRRNLAGRYGLPNFGEEARL